jgi:hypothetical protein
VIVARKAPALVDLTAGVGRVREQLSELRSKGAALQADIELEAGRPVPSGEVERRIEETIATLRDLAERGAVVGDLVSVHGAPGRLAHGLAELRVPPFALSALLHPDLVRAWLLRRAEAALATLPDPVDAQERARRVRELEAELAEVERQEASLMWQAAEAGLDLPWRADANPRVVLGLPD